MFGQRKATRSCFCMPAPRSADASRFTRSAPDQSTWTQQKTAVPYTYPGGTPRPQQTLPALKLEIPATLVLKAYTDADAPPGKQAGDLYVGSDDAAATNPMFPATLIYSPSEVSNNDSLTWLAADGKLYFSYHSDAVRFSSGRLLFRPSA